MIPINHSARRGASPAFAGARCPKAPYFVLMMRDLDAASGGTEEILHWMLWNIPWARRALPEGLLQATQLPTARADRPPVRIGSALGRLRQAPCITTSSSSAPDTTRSTPAVGRHPRSARPCSPRLRAVTRGKAAYVDCSNDRPSSNSAACRFACSHVQALRRALAEASPNTCGRRRPPARWEAGGPQARVPDLELRTCTAASDFAWTRLRTLSLGLRTSHRLRTPYSALRTLSFYPINRRADDNTCGARRSSIVSQCSPRPRL